MIRSVLSAALVSLFSVGCQIDNVNELGRLATGDDDLCLEMEPGVYNAEYTARDPSCREFAEEYVLVKVSDGEWKMESYNVYDIRGAGGVIGCDSPEVFSCDVWCTATLPNGCVYDVLLTEGNL